MQRHDRRQRERRRAVERVDDVGFAPQLAGPAVDLFVESLLFGAGSAFGFSLVLILFAGIRERVEGADVPVYFRGAAIAMVTAGLMALAFMGFAGLDKYQ